MITIHHLGVSQSERIVWLMEELALPYKLKWYDRMPNRPARSAARGPEGDVDRGTEGSQAQAIVV
jgi:glutathione S-transferase